MPEFPVPVADCFERIADDLASKGWSVQPGALSSELALSLSQACRQLWQSDALTPAAIGRGADLAVVPQIRGDYTRWLDDCPPQAAQDEYLAVMQGLQLTLNRALFLGLDSFETHFALYPPGAGYSRHLDRFKDSPLRTVSVVAYLNQQWQPGDGGELRLHLREGIVDIEPKAGTLAVFMSARILHEVLEAGKERASLVGWFRRRPDNPLFR
ncbi:MAG TPA: 2OG-Fe(II) oxygenase [Pseudomonas xinjiangensis]|uniref:2OG-Fe(II) oxygenase n=2 Tax=root TaxID=1 RepID=A0A7V1BPT2_9GAMM|nr:2OG-Fe(II) oxygenase [Halopseudomonas xinjiangensis]HEC48497.1 2OG-Fe(II) oxygenase [Halopseudomonas xinjiangensis]